MPKSGYGSIATLFRKSRLTGWGREMVKRSDRTVRDEDSSFAVHALRNCAKRLQGFVRRKVRRDYDVDDVMQEVYLRLLRTDRAEVKQPIAFLLRAASYVAADFSEREGREFFPSAGDAVEVCSNLASEALGDKLDEWLSIKQELEKALAIVPPMYRAIVILVNRDGMSYEEVGKIMGLKPSTVHVYATRARAAIRMGHWSYGKNDDGRNDE
jgi:RNA polymerase sigma factor (sigma-70 family)